MTAELQYRLDLPYAAPPAALRGNFRGHWSQRSKASHSVRGDVYLLGRAAGIRDIADVEHVAVELTWAPGDRRVRDEDNLWPFLKACADALGPMRYVHNGARVTHFVGLGIVPDDSPRWMTKRAPRILPPPDRGLWLDVVVQLAAAELAG